MLLLGIFSSQVVAADYWTTIQNDGALAAWKLTETSGSTVTDFINSKTMTGYGTYTLNQSGPGSTGDGANKAIDYDGSTGYHKSASESFFDHATSGSWAIECWIKDNTTTGYRNFLTWRNGEIGGGLYLNVPGAGIVNAYVTNSSGGLIELNGTSNVMNNNWHHIVLTAESGGSLYLYVDGVQEASSSTARSTSVTNRYFCTGANAAVPTQFFPGLVAAPAYYESYLTSTKVNNHYTKGTL